MPQEVEGQYHLWEESVPELHWEVVIHSGKDCLKMVLEVLLCAFGKVLSSVNG